MVRFLSQNNPLTLLEESPATIEYTGSLEGTDTDAEEELNRVEISECFVRTLVTSLLMLHICPSAGSAALPLIIVSLL